VTTALLLYLCLKGAYPHTCTSEEVWAPSVWDGPNQIADCVRAKREAYREVALRAPRQRFVIRFACETQPQGE
jgi:hypothetical protein